MRKRALINLVVWGGECAKALDASRSQVKNFIEGFAQTAIDDENRIDVTTLIYDIHPHHLDNKVSDKEMEVFAEVLPPAPAKILIGGCGTGREGRYLSELGYEVFGFDPSSKSMKTCQKQFSSKQNFEVMTYEDLINDTERSRSRFGASLNELSFDAILLGLGSLIHILDPNVHRELFKTLNKLCPSGPIFGGFYYRARPKFKVYKKAHLIGQQMGRWLGRQQKPLQKFATNQEFDINFGYCYTFSKKDLDAIAEIIERDIKIYPNSMDMPFVSFISKQK